MRILGISEPDSDAGAALIENGKVLYAANEERFSRKKQHQGFPHLTIEWLLKVSGWKLEDIDVVALAKPTFWQETRQNFAPYFKNQWFKGGGFFRSVADAAIHLGYFLPVNLKTNVKLNREINAWLKENHISEKKLVRVNHHLGHAASAYYISGFEEACVVTCDGQGAGETATVWHGKGGQLTKVHQVYVPHSMGYFYGLVTYLLGYKPNRHEGKITGLAGFGVRDETVYELCKEVAAFNSEKGTFTVRNLFGNIIRWRRLIRDSKSGPKGVSAAFQQRLEDVLVPFVQHYVKKMGVSRVAMAGGVFANVKLNQRIHEIPEVKEVFVCPQMNDGGLGMGAALAHAAAVQPFSPYRIENVYWGPEFSQEAIEEALKKYKVTYRKPEQFEKEVARLLNEKKVVAVFQGRMEAGPRALGNRSILYEARDPAVNDWLNERLNRSEFMPFAPVTLWEDRDLYYENMEGGDVAAQFMTITVNCTPKCLKEAAAAVHKDGTARPQLIRETQNPRYYGILKEYKNLTGCSTLINTSFNMHEEPIVCTPEDAVRAYLQGRLDVLAIGDFLVESPSEEAIRLAQPSVTST